MPSAVRYRPRGLGDAGGFAWSMARFGFSGRVRARAAALLASVAIVGPAAARPAIVAPRPAIGEQRAGLRYTVALTQRDRFEGEMEATTFVCRPTGACIGQARIEVVGWPHDYALSAPASDTRVLLFFWRRGDHAALYIHPVGGRGGASPHPAASAASSPGGGPSRPAHRRGRLAGERVGRNLLRRGVHGLRGGQDAVPNQPVDRTDADAEAARPFGRRPSPHAGGPGRTPASRGACAAHAPSPTSRPRHLRSGTAYG